MGSPATGPCGFNHSLSRIDFVLENRSHDAHVIESAWCRGLPPGNYDVSLNRASIANFAVQAESKAECEVAGWRERRERYHSPQVAFGDLTTAGRTANPACR